MKKISFFIFVITILNSAYAMEEVRRQTLYRVIAEEIKYYNRCIQIQKNSKEIYEAPLVINGKLRLMRARFLTKSHNYQLDISFGKGGIQCGPLCE